MTNDHKSSNLTQNYLRTLEVSLCRAAFLSGSLWGESVSLPFAALRSHPQALAHGPLPSSKPALSGRVFLMLPSLWFSLLIPSSTLKDPCDYTGEGNGTPLQYSCLENPMDGGTWWAAVHGVTRLHFHFHFSLSCIGEGNGNPLQCSFLENPRDGGAWWAAVSGVAQSQTRLK